MKFYGGVLGSTMKNWLNFGCDLGILRWVNEENKKHGNATTTSNLPDRGCIQVGLITNLYCVLYNRIMQRRLASSLRGQ